MPQLNEGFNRYVDLPPVPLSPSSPSFDDLDARFLESTGS